MTLDLDNLRRVAEAATPGAWDFHDDGEGGLTVYDSRHGDGLFTTSGVRAFNTNSSSHLADCEQVAAFDPPTVLALIDRLEAAEALARRWSEQVTDYSDDAEQQIEDGHELREALEMPDDCSCGECDRRRNPPPPMTAEESRAADERLAHLLGELNRKVSAAITRALDVDLTASKSDGGAEGHRDDDNAGDGRCEAQEGKR